MFQDQKQGAFWRFSRGALMWTLIVLAPPVAALAVVPILVGLLVLTVVALPFMALAFFADGTDAPTDTWRVRAWRMLAVRVHQTAPVARASQPHAL
jgi:hypothetical protein